MPPRARRHDHDAGGPAELLAAKAALREQVWAAMSAARVARFPGAAGRIPNFTGAEAAAERLRELPEWRAASGGHPVGGADRGEDRRHPVACRAARRAPGPVNQASRAEAYRHDEGHHGKEYP